MITKEELFEAIKDVKHPAINCSLAELGIAKDLEDKGETIQMTIALPFAGVPENIRNIMTESLTKELYVFEKDIEVSIELMTEGVKENFMRLETENWLGKPE